MKWLAAGMFVVGIVGLVWLQVSSGHRNAQLRAQTDSARIVTRALEDSQRVWHRRDSLRLDSAKASARRGTALATAYRERLADSLRAGFDSVVSAKDATIRGLFLVVAHQDTIIAQQAAAIRLQVQLTAAWQRKAEPSLVQRVLREMPVLVGVYTLGRLTR